MILFTTERMTVRCLRESDAPALYAALSDPEVMRYIEPPFSKEKTEAFIASVMAADAPPVYAVERDGAVIGHLIYHPYDGESWELGWILGREHWGLGLTSELTRGAIAHAGRNGVPALVLECAPEQTATRRIAEKYGFRPVGESGGLALYKKEL